MKLKSIWHDSIRLKFRLSRGREILVTSKIIPHIKMFMHIYELFFYNINAPKEHCMWLLVAFEVDLKSRSLSLSLIHSLLVMFVSNLIRMNLIWIRVCFFSSSIFSTLSVYIIWRFIPALLLGKVKSFLKLRESSLPSTVATGTA